jgi:hypothetical protein
MRSLSAIEALVFVFILVIVILATYYIATTNYSSASDSAPNVIPSRVTVTGTVSTKTFGTWVSSIRFTRMSDSLSYRGNLSDGNLVATLPNQATYSVTIQWQSPLIAGDCNAGTLPLYIGYTTSFPSTSWSC